MDVNYSQQWILKAVRSGLLEPQQAAALLRAEVAVPALGRINQTRLAPTNGAGRREQIVRLDLAGAPATWGSELASALAGPGPVPTAVLVDGTAPGLDAEPWLVHDGLADLIRAWLRGPRPASLRLVYLSGAPTAPLTAAVTAFFRSLNAEEHAVYATVLAGAVGPAEIEQVLHEVGPVDPCRCHEGPAVWVPGTGIAVASPPAAGTVLRANGSYLISGGLGALGFALARHLAREYQARLVLLGARPAADAGEALAVLRSLGGDPSYLSVDLADPGAGARLAAGLGDVQTLQGVVHCAGTTRDALLRLKTREQSDAVLLPKVRGVGLLDEATAGYPLDFFVAYSSISGLMGNAGQTDYAFANAYLDGFLNRRSSAVAQGRRSGRSVSIAWPFWAEGGTPIPAESLDRLRAATGIQPMPNWLGIAQFEAAIELAEPLYAPVCGDATNWAADPLGSAAAPTGTTKTAALGSAEVNDDARAGLVAHLLQTFADLYEIAPESVRPDAALESYGLDSVLIARLSRKLTEVLPQLPVSVFFTSSTIDELADAINERHPELVAKRFGAPRPADPTPKAVTQAAPTAPAPTPVAAQEPMRIAIVGQAARLAQADSAAEVWEALAAGADQVTTYPANRRLPFAAATAAGFAIPGVTEEDWHQPGSFLADVWGFDAGFFGLAAREARSMDPQERLALESAWHAFEDAGITPQSAREETDGAVGVFGSMTGHTHEQFGGYQLGADSYQPQSYSWSLANRISSFFDFNGPSETVDTACSSSLYSLARACDALRSGQCSMAVVTASNLYLHPHKFTMLRERGMLSPTGRCQAFGAGADGFVPAEAVVTLVLKPLADAERDGDRIHGVVWSWGLNHSGSTHGYTVPSPRAQADVIRQALRTGGLRPAEVSYVEAHGTGTALGDPIEVDGLIEVFGADRDPSTPLGIGSVKSNYGHAESAAGLVSLVKVLKQMEHGRLAPSLHASNKNPQVRLDGAPLFIVESPVEWRHSVEEPRFAGISSFGAGGSNAHVIVRTGRPARPLAQPPADGKLPFLFSAADPAALLELLSRYHAWLADQDVALPALAATLAHDRSHLDERVCIFAGDRVELLDRLATAARDATGVGVLRGSVRDRADRLGEIDPAAVSHHREQVAAWLTGTVVDWQLPRAARGELSLPHYPFQHRPHHVTVEAGPAARPGTTAESGSAVTGAVPASSGAPTGAVAPTADPQTSRGPAPLRRLDFINDIPKTIYEDREVDQPMVERQNPEPGIVVLRMDNGNGNLMDTPLYRGLAQAFDQVNHDDSVKVVILTGTDRLFHMGGTQQSLDEIAIRDTSCSDGNLFYLGLPSIRVPVISAMTGHAHGGGVTFGLSADIPILAEESLYGASFMNINFTPGIGSTYFFRKRFGPAISQEMFLTGRDYTGRQLRELGPDIRILPKAQVMAEAMQIARSIAKKSLHALQVYKHGQTEKVLREIQPFILAEEQMQNELFDQDHIDTARDDIKRIFGAQQDAGESRPAAPSRVVLQTPAAQQSPQPAVEGTHGPIALRPLTAAQPTSSAGAPAAPTVVPQSVSAANTQVVPQASQAAPASSDLVAEVVGELAEVLKEDPADLDLRRGVSELGLDSVGALELVQRLNERFGCALGAEVVYQYPRAIDLAQGIAAGLPIAAQPSSPPPSQPAAVTLADTVELSPLSAAPQVVTQTATGATREAVWGGFVEVLQSVIRFAADDVPDLRRNFQELGVDSVAGLELVGALNERFGTSFQASDLYGYGSALDLISDLHPATCLPDAPGPAPSNALQGVLERLGRQDLSVDDVLEMLEQR